MTKRIHDGHWRKVCLAGLFFFLIQAAGLDGQALKGDDLNQFTWRNIGPFTFSGRITDFAVPHGQNTVYYAAAASGGIWKTVDHGISFEPVFDVYGNMSIGNIEVAPSNPDIIYMGTGEPLHARSSAHGNGMWKSADAGKTWTHIGLEKSYFIPKIAVDFQNPDVVYAAAEGKLYSNEADCQRGLYKTEDGGKTWLQVLDLKDRGVGEFVMDPGNSDVVIAGAYKTYRRTWTFIDRQPGNHFYKTSDGGKTWKKLTEGLPLNIKTGWNGITIYPKDTNIVYIRMDEEVNLGLDDRKGRQFYREGRMFRDDFYFSDFKSYAIPNSLKKMVEFEPLQAEDEEELVEKVNQMIEQDDFIEKTGVDLTAFLNQAGKIYQDDQDMMKCLEEVEKILEDRTEEKQEKENGGRIQILNRFVLQALYGKAFQPMEPVTKSGVVYRSEDQGETWTRMTEYKIRGGSQQINAIEAGYAGRIEVDPNQSDVLYAVEVIPKISRDGGKNFKNLPWSGWHKTHVDMRNIWIDPLDSNHILSANDGGASETWDGGEHWSQKETIEAQQFYDVATDNQNPYNVMGGTQDNGCWLGPSRNRNQYGVFPADWVYLPSGDGFYVERDWWNPEYVYFESQFGNSSRLNLKTGERIRLSHRNTQEEREAGKAPQRYQWDAPIVLSSHNPGIVYVCSQHVHRSLSRGEPGTWETISPDLSKADPERIAQSKLTNLQYATIYTFAESPMEPGIYWAGTDDGNLQVSTDGGNTWTNLTERFYDNKGRPKGKIQGARILYDHWVTKVEPSAHKKERCYVTYSGYRTHDEDHSYIFVTEDMGQTWTDLSRGMMNPVRDMEEDPDNENVLYLATDYGLFVSLDRGQNWMQMNPDSPDVMVMSIDIQKRERDMAVGTYGRGIHIMDIYPFKEMTREVLEKPNHLFEIQDIVKWNMKEMRGQQYGEFARVTNPPTGGDMYYYLKEDFDSVKILIKDAAGELVQEMALKSKPGLHKAFWNLREKGEEGSSRRRASLVEPGDYQVILHVNEEEVMQRILTVKPDPVY
jgi:photosystem II stability/assembly factor-like uncharacterized protein